jgi:hypothetical protein
MDTRLSLSNLNLVELNRQRRIDFQLDPASIYPWWRRCTVNTLILTDGGLDFGNGDFGLSAFLNILLNDRPYYANFQITLGHLRSSPGPAAMLLNEQRIANRITGFRFDDPAHFAADMYDEVWMFGIETDFHNGGYPTRSADPARYPSDRLGDEELRRISAHMDRGGGIFATGDHGALGRGLCGSIKRVRNMRHWNSFPNSSFNDDEVGMAGPRRNDTNLAGHDPGTQFSDQSDDLPQTLDLKLYSTRMGHLSHSSWPHPVLCGRNGRLDVLPDHPHEGECQVPPDLDLDYDFDKSKEYPDATDGSGQVVPEIIATSRVPAGNTADKTGSKAPTIAHSFGAISAYDGHRAGRGRVVCDATWHHFINVNLIGVVESGIFDQFGDPNRIEDTTKHDGFLSTPQGLAALDKIKNYFTNIGVWIAPPERIACFGRRFWWDIIYKERIMEAALVDPAVRFERIPIDVHLAVGKHARDVLGRFASQCQTTLWLHEFIEFIWPELMPWINPWEAKIKIDKEQIPPLPIFDPQPILDVTLGGAIIAMRQAFPFAPEKFDDGFDEKALAAAQEGAKMAMTLALQNTRAVMKDVSQLMRSADDRL